MFSPGASIDDQRYGNGQALKVDRSVPMTVVIFIYLFGIADANQCVQQTFLL
jgi:hypothetical protein